MKVKPFYSLKTWRKNVTKSRKGLGVKENLTPAGRLYVLVREQGFKKNLVSGMARKNLFLQTVNFPLALPVTFVNIKTMHLKYFLDLIILIFYF